MKKVFYILSGMGLSLTLAFGIMLSSVKVFAEETAVDTINITVPEACTITDMFNTGAVHQVTMTGGQYKENIGGITTLEVFCNTKYDFAVYAVGFSNNEYGNNEMLASSAGSPNIPTGTATSGNTSQWAMQLMAVASSNNDLVVPTITEAFKSYAAVPSGYVKVAEASTTITGSMIRSQIAAMYAAYVSPTQPTGTYTGKVKYTVVHPSSIMPEGPYETEAGKIGYYPNARGVTDTMGDQEHTGYTSTVSNFTTPISNNSEATLWASNFKRQGYGFAGWSDKHDWVLNANDASGNGTGANVGYHIYGPNQTITMPNNIENKGLSLYAVWVKSAGTIQEWGGCGAMNIGEVTALTDSRDNNTYAVAKLADGKCWMVENLRLSNEDASGNPIILTAENTNNPKLPITNTISPGQPPIEISSDSLSASQDPTVIAWCIGEWNICINKSMLYAGNTIDSVDNMSSPNSAVFLYGNYYNLYSATAGNSGSSTQGNNGSICPNGWRLPTGDFANDDIKDLFVAMGGDISLAQTSNFWRAYPGNFLYSGRVSGSSTGNRGVKGYYYSSSSTGLEFDKLYYGNFYSSGGEYLGNAIRCISDI